MALSRIKTWNAAATLTAADLNAEYNNICNHFGSLDNDDINSTATFTMGELIVGSGITSADGGQLHVHTATAGTIQANADADEAVFENSGASGLTILSGATSTGNIAFGDSGDADNGLLKYTHGSTPTLGITVNATAVQSIAAAATTLAHDLAIYQDANNADSQIALGTSATEALFVDALNGGSNKTLEELRFTTKTASGTAHHGKMSFYVDEVNIGNINDDGITLESGKIFTGNITGNVTGNASGTAATVTGGTQAAITTCANLTTTGTVTTGTWSGVIDGSATMTLGSDATGDIYFRDASGHLERLASGADGYVLTGTGAGSIPAWEAVSAGVSLSGSTPHTVATVTGANALEGEANLTFDGSTLTVTGDQHIANGSGLVVGNTAQVAVGGVTPEMQVLGTAAADSAMTVGTFSADAASPLFYFIKSRAGSIGAGASASNAADDGDRLGQIIWCVDDGTDYQHDGARIWAEAEGDAASNNIPTSLHFGTCPSGASTIAERMRIDSAGRVGFNISPVPTAFNTLGVVIDQKTGDDDVLSFRSTGDITQAMTDLADTACYGQFRKASATAGALQITGFGEGNGGLYLFGRQGSEDTSDASGSIGAVYCQSSKASGTSVAAISDSGNLFAVGNGGTCRMLIKGNGVMHISNTTLVALDEEDDIGLVRAFQKASSKGMGVVMSKWDEVMKENEDDLRRVGVLSSESDFVIQQNFNSLIGGSVWQLYTKLQDTKEFYENKIAALESRLMRLEN